MPSAADIQRKLIVTEEDKVNPTWSEGGGEADLSWENNIFYERKDTQ